MYRGITEVTRYFLKCTAVPVTINYCNFFLKFTFNAVHFEMYRGITEVPRYFFKCTAVPVKINSVIF